MADPNIFIVNPADPAEVVGVVSDEVAAPKSEPQPEPEPEALTDAPPLKTKARPRQD